MKALIAFIGMALVIIVLIEINERIKAKKKPTSDSSLKGREETAQVSFAKVWGAHTADRT